MCQWHSHLVIRPFGTLLQEGTAVTPEGGFCIAPREISYEGKPVRIGTWPMRAPCVRQGSLGR